MGGVAGEASAFAPQALGQARGEIPPFQIVQRNCIPLIWLWPRRIVIRSPWLMRVEHWSLAQHALAPPVREGCAKQSLLNPLTSSSADVSRERWPCAIF